MDVLRILAELHAERERIDQAIAVLEALNGTIVSRQSARKTNKKTSPMTRSTTKKKRVISPEGRLRMAEAQQKRWAKKKKATKAAAKAV